MVGWFGFTALYSTGMHSVLSQVFGSYSDQRMIQALADKAPVEEIVKRYDYSAPGALPGGGEGGPVWVDYLADTGDGFDSTFAIASLVGAPSLEIEGAGTLPGGQVLVMGGDQVYPFASFDQYDARLLTPFASRTPKPRRPTASCSRSPATTTGTTACPLSINCSAARATATRTSSSSAPGRCEQHRSYFAIKLPHNWWIWGLDTQLTRNFDMEQIQYFRDVSEHMMDREKAKIIICIPEPSWYDAAETGKEASYPESLNKILPASFRARQGLRDHRRGLAPLQPLCRRSRRGST